MVETPSGWLGAWDKSAFEAYAAVERERWEKAVCTALDLCDCLQTKKALDMLADMVKHRRA
jgi:hypothetical protein